MAYAYISAGEQGCLGHRCGFLHPPGHHHRLDRHDGCQPFKGKNINLHFLAPAQRNLLQPILLSYEAPFRSNLQKSTAPVSYMIHNIFDQTKFTGLCGKRYKNNPGKR